MAKQGSASPKQHNAKPVSQTVDYVNTVNKVKQAKK